MSVAPRPLHYATYFDRRYLTRGIALYRSLERHSPPFVLWVLCLDETTRAVLTSFKLPYVRLVPLCELERADAALLSTKSTRNRVEYYWTCGPAFLAWLFARQPEIETLTYVDADTYFVGDPTPMFRELGDGSILLIHHRWASPIPDVSVRKGRFQVGLIVFRRTRDGVASIGDWREQCIAWCYDRIEADRFGDQKYLEQWPTRYSGVVLSELPGADLAPWNASRYTFFHDGARLWVDDSLAISWHFNRLRRITPWLYQPCVWRRRADLSRPVREHLYVPYIRELRSLEAEIRGVHRTQSGVEAPRADEGLIRLLASIALRRNFVIVTDSIAVWA